MPWPQDDSPISPQPTPFGHALWKLLTNAVPAQLNTAGNLAAGVARPFTNLFGNGGQEFWQGPQNPQAAQDMRSVLATMYAPSAINPVEAAAPEAASEFAAMYPGMGKTQTLFSGPGGIKAYHGSPYDFDKFDSSKIGTGEGAQAYGHGLYFAESPGVAESYKKINVGMDADGNLIFPPGINKSQIYEPLNEANARMDAVNGKMDDLHARMISDSQTRNASADRPDAQAIAKYKDQWNALAQEHTAAQEAITKAGLQGHGRMYEVNINASPDQFLDWDKPYGEQTPGVQAAIDRAGGHAKVFGAIDAVRDGTVERNLAQQGIPGIRYLDQGSRGSLSVAPIEQNLANARAKLAEWQNSAQPHAQAQRQMYQDEIAQLEKNLASAKATQQTYNYVVFPGNEHLIEIVKKYGLAGAAAAMGMKQADLAQMMGLVGSQNKGTNQ